MQPAASGLFCRDLPRSDCRSCPGFSLRGNGIRRSALKALPTRGRGVRFQIGAVLQHSNTPSLRVAEFEDEDDDEDSLSDVAFCALCSEVLLASEVGRTKRLTSGVQTQHHAQLKMVANLLRCSLSRSNARRTAAKASANGKISGVTSKSGSAAPTGCQ
jgi:hypothetical protein